MDYANSPLIVVITRERDFPTIVYPIRTPRAEGGAGTSRAGFGGGGHGPSVVRGCDPPTTVYTRSDAMRRGRRGYIAHPHLLSIYRSEAKSRNRFISCPKMRFLCVIKSGYSMECYN